MPIKRGVSRKSRGDIAYRDYRIYLWPRKDAASMPQTIELAPRSDGARYRRLTLSLERDGVLALASHEMGAHPDDVWGLDDAEVTLTIPADQLGRLAMALAAELLEGQTDALARLREVCDDHGIEARLANWT
jgi:hypothetical protein